MHASVSAPVADFLLLDRQWKRRVLEAAPPKAYPWVFYRNGSTRFLTPSNSVSSFRPYRPEATRRPAFGQRP